MAFDDDIQMKYKEMLANYIQELTEQALYEGQRFSWKAIEHKIPPEEIINIHLKVLKELLPDIPKKILDSFDFLLEVMVGYGLAYQEHQFLRGRQLELKSEIEIAANVQQALLQTNIPKVEELDIGVISVPAKIMNGDYYQFAEHENTMSVAIADVIGKGIPAALCISMIKYAMDSLLESRQNPSYILENLNRVVEQNIDVNMFITMFFGKYDFRTNKITYASAGHEPGFYYCASEDHFYDLQSKGLVLGVDRQVKYEQYELNLFQNDMIILLSDGVTETRTKEGFIDRAAVTSAIRAHLHLPAQQIVENIYKDFEKMQGFQLRDDFTLIIMKKNV
ncbi:phosphoserine phosphatase [Aeribacillus pallidus]|jgi:phosphoserine phosphatase RsbU/P|uniref:Phosphoserine phosphatase n=1 Tax=Aeribacillus pallidus TaxID=33936 RepID=A0A165XKA5_9BACI|nr:PP2C family protein-serine/threonine phosphatase [Aeribacillus pallidus]KZN96119.1 phosphoserine phosphatase [Aeribacillus pallidus]